MLKKWERAAWPQNADRGAVSFDGIAGLPQYRPWSPRWRFAWPRRVIHVMNQGRPYYVYFSSAGRCKKLIRPRSAPYLSVRIGPKGVFFCARDAATDEPVPLSALGRKATDVIVSI